MKKVKLTLNINGVEIERNFNFELGKFEDHDWDKTVLDMFDTFLETEEENRVEDMAMYPTEPKEFDQI